MIGWLVPAMATMAMALPTTADGVSISVTDNVTSVRPDDTIEYQVTLHNTDRTEPATVHVELSLPVGAASKKVSEGGEALEPWLATWNPTVPAGGTTTVTATFTAGDARPNAKGYAAQACLVTNNINQACGTDINQLPGKANIHAAMATPEPSTTPPWPIWLGAAGALAAAAVVTIHRKRPEPETDDGPAQPAAT